jgi:hypothetical protein
MIGGIYCDNKKLLKKIVQKTKNWAEIETFVVLWTANQNVCFFCGHKPNLKSTLHIK